MSKFEVHIPATDGNGFNVTLKVGADNWMSALKAGLQKLGEQGTISQNVMVDIQEDNSIHVTEAASGRVFRIRELTEEEAAKAQVKRPSQIRPAPARAETKTEPSLAAVKRPEDKTQPLPPAPASRGASANDVTAKGGDALKLPADDMSKTLPGGVLSAIPASVPNAVPRNATPAPRQNKPSARLELKDVEELVQPIRPSTGSIGRVKSSPNLAKSQRQETEDILADIFLRVVELGSKKEIEEAMEFVLDLVMEKVPCEAGSVLRADGATGDLTFVAARGPKAKEIMKSKLIVPAGTGIAGFCASEGVSVAVSDVEKDPRFYAEVGERIGYATRSMLCAPMMTHGRSFGCVQVINRKGGPQFLEHEVGVMAYLAHQAALFMNQKLLE
ncbi:MAG: GAF domain-containing protein [Archangium sp.]|nr:GAF domain-containing protein [Archangium sp.]MDP3570199.1 GAF domain-containing protein [Archangium sp.]